MLGCVARDILVRVPVVPFLLDLIEPVIVGKLTTGVVNAIVAAFTLATNTVDSDESALEVGNGYQVAAGRIVILRIDLSLRIAAEESFHFHLMR